MYIRAHQTEAAVLDGLSPDTALPEDRLVETGPEEVQHCTGVHSTDTIHNTDLHWGEVVRKYCYT